MKELIWDVYILYVPELINFGFFFPASCRVGVAEFKYKVQMLLLCLTYLSLNTCAGLYIYLYNSRDYLKPNDIYIYTEIGILVHLKINIVY